MKKSLLSRNWLSVPQRINFHGLADSFLWCAHVIKLNSHILDINIMIGYGLELISMDEHSAEIALIHPGLAEPIIATMVFSTFDDQHQFEGWSAQLAHDEVARIFEHASIIHPHYYASEPEMRDGYAMVAIYCEFGETRFAARLPTDDVYIELNFGQITFG